MTVQIGAAQRAAGQKRQQAGRICTAIAAAGRFFDSESATKLWLLWTDDPRAREIRREVAGGDVRIDLDMRVVEPLVVAGRLVDLLCDRDPE